MKRSAADSGQWAVGSGQWTVGSGQWAAVPAAAKRSRRHPNLRSANPPPSAFRLPPFGFTLVELLVVVVIISMLVGLLLPALIAARGRARIAQCTNNQHELALAITQYDVAKQRLPGYVNRVRNTPVSWVPVLFPYLGRMDLWEGIPNTGFNPPYDGWRYATPMTNPATTTMRVRINQLICPDDADISVACPLTYVVNLGVYNVPPIPPALGLTTPVIPGVFQNYSGGTGNAISLSSVKSASRTVMLSEKNIPILSPGRQWTDVVDATIGIEARLGFSWPNDPPAPASPQPTVAQTNVLKEIDVNNPLPPIHRGIVIVTFCDGHTESLADDAPCSDYLAVP